MKSLRLLIAIAFVIPFLSCNAQPEKKKLKQLLPLLIKLKLIIFTSLHVARPV